MTDIIDTQEKSVNEYVAPSETPESKPPLTVAYLIKSLTEFDQESELVAAIQGINLTIPIVGAMSVDSEEGKKLTILQMSAAGTKAALDEHHNIVEAMQREVASQDIN